MRSPTEVETEHVNMAEFVPIRQVTLSELRAATEGDAELELLTAVRTGQKIWQLFPSLYVVILTSGRNFQFRMVLCSRVKESWYHTV